MNILKGSTFRWRSRIEVPVARDSPDGVRRIKSQIFTIDKYPTESSVWRALEGQLGSLNENTLAGKVKYTMGQLCDKYLTEELPTLADSTR